MRILGPAVVKVIVQLPLPLETESVRVQSVSAPVISTVPVGVVPAPVTVTVTVTTWPGMVGSGKSAMVVVEVANPAVDTEWLAVPELLAWLASPLYVAVRVLTPGVLKTTLQ